MSTSHQQTGGEGRSSSFSTPSAARGAALDPAAGTDPQRVRAGVTAVALAATGWALGATVASTLFSSGVDALELVEVRTFITAVGLGLICLFTSRRWRHPPVQRRLQLAAFGLAIALANGAFFMAIARLPVAVAIVLQNLAPTFVIAWNAIRLRRLPSARVRLALAGATVGVVLVAGLGHRSAAPISWTGLGFGLVTAVGVAAFTLLGEPVSRDYGSVGATARAFAVASAFWLLFQIPSGIPHTVIHASFLPKVLFVAVVGTLLPFVIFAWGVRHARTDRAGIAISLEPVVGGVVAWVWLHQRLSLLQVLGGVLTIAAVLAVRNEERPLDPPRRRSGHRRTGR
jgi:DME family drug/metabolite transporter